MNKVFGILFLVILMGNLVACKKDAKSQIPAALIGKWYVRQYTTTSSSNAFSDTPYTVRFSDTATNVYIQFKNDGTGLEEYSADPNFVSVPPLGFTYNISGNNITFSQITAIMMGKTYSFEMPTSNSLLLHINYSYTAAGMVINNVQEITLGR
ncbi:MAG TPA: lipocalin family protein [Mucilaginibacter sp.]